MRPPTNIGKRAQVDKDKTLALVAIGIASVVLMASIIIGKAFWSQANYLGKIADKKEEAVRQLEDNLVSVDSLRASYQDFVSQNPNLISGNISGDGQNDGDNAELILDALPSEYDFPALVSSVEFLLSAYQINNITGTDDSINQQAVVKGGGVVEIPLTLDFTSNYEGHRQAIESLKRSIRPFKVTSMEINGSGSTLTTSVNVITYFQPESGLIISKEDIK